MCVFARMFLKIGPQERNVSLVTSNYSCTAQSMMGSAVRTEQNRFRAFRVCVCVSHAETVKVNDI